VDQNGIIETLNFNIVLKGLLGMNQFIKFV